MLSLISCQNCSCPLKWGCHFEADPIIKHLFWSCDAIMAASPPHHHLRPHSVFIKRRLEDDNWTSAVSGRGWQRDKGQHCWHLFLGSLSGRGVIPPGARGGKAQHRCVELPAALWQYEMRFPPHLSAQPAEFHYLYLWVRRNKALLPAWEIFHLARTELFS